MLSAAALATPDEVDSELLVLAPTSVTQTSATLRLSAQNPNQGECLACHFNNGNPRDMNVLFVYGTSPGNLNLQTSQRAFVGSHSQAVINTATFSHSLSVSGLTCGTTYNYRAVARLERNQSTSGSVPSMCSNFNETSNSLYCLESNASRSFATLACQGPPDTPAGVAASDGVDTDRVEVTWSAVDNAIEYKVRRAGSASGQATELATVSGTRYDDRTATPGTTFWYDVQACNIQGCSAPSARNSGSRAVPALPAPANVSATDGTDANAVVVRWGAVAGATGYEVRRRSGSQSASPQTLATVPGNSFTDAAALPGTLYFYSVRACDSRCSDDSAVDSGWRSLAAPADLKASDASYVDRVHVRWRAVSQADRYQVFRTSGSAVGNSSPITTTNELFFVDTSASTTSRTYFVRACQSDRCGQTSADSGRRATSAEPISFRSRLSGGDVVPPVSSSASGVATLTLSADRRTLRYDIEFSGLDLKRTLADRTAPRDVLAVHIHVGARGEAGPHALNIFGNIPTQDDDDAIFDFAGERVSGAWDDSDVLGPGPYSAPDTRPLSLLVDQLIEGELYLQIHTRAFSAGEIRGQIVRTRRLGAVPTIIQLLLED